MAQEKWLIEQGPKTIDIGAIRSLKVGLIGGRIDVIGHAEPRHAPGPAALLNGHGWPQSVRPPPKPRPSL